MTRDIKATVEELERLCTKGGTPFVVALAKAWPTIFTHLSRLLPIEEAALRYRETSEAYQELKLSADMAAVNYAHRRNAEAREDLFAALPPRPSEGEEGKP